MLNMARGLGTAVGLAATGLVFTAFAGSHPEHAAASSVFRGVRYAALLLALASAATLVLSFLRGVGPLSKDPTAGVE